MVAAEEPLFSPRRCYLGIDPGLNGAVAVIYQPSHPLEPTVRLWKAFETPVLVAKKKGRVRREYEIQDMKDLLVTLTTARRELPYAVIEQVSPMPMEGIVSASRAGFGAGIWHGLLTALCIPFRVVHPAVWKRAQGLTGKDKNYSRLVASERFPGVDLGKVKDHGKAEALLLADYARRMDW